MNNTILLNQQIVDTIGIQLLNGCTLGTESMSDGGCAY